MPVQIDENPTRKKIIVLLKKADNMTVSELSKEIGITPMAIRQHLMSLEKKGMITYTARKYGIGRPVFHYRLTNKATEMFPKAYAALALDILGSIEEMDGRKKVDRLFMRRRDKQHQAMAAVLDGMQNMEDKVSMLTKMLNDEGYMVETSQDDRTYTIKHYNCLLQGVSSDFPEACKYELDLYRLLFDKKVTRTECQSDGGPSCTYVIPK